MLLTTRDAQRERRNSLYLASALVADRLSTADRLSMAGFDNSSFRADSILDLRSLNVRKSFRNASFSHSESIENQIRPCEQQESNESPNTEPVDAKRSKKFKYQWKMTHFFFIHMGLFVFNSLLGGLIVYLIENYSSIRNRVIEVAFIDAWFVSTTCVCSCGLITVDFASLSGASQGVLMFFTFISGITVSTLPALLIKALTHKTAKGLRVDDDHDRSDDDEDNDDNELPTVRIRKRKNLPSDVRQKLSSLPNSVQLRYRAYITCIFVTLLTCLFVYSLGFIAIGAWIDGKYTAEQLLQGNTSVNPWYISFVVTLTGFNQNGLVPFSDGFSRFVDDVFLNLSVMFVSQANLVL